MTGIQWFLTGVLLLAADGAGMLVGHFWMRKEKKRLKDEWEARRRGSEYEKM